MPHHIKYATAKLPQLKTYSELLDTVSQNWSNDKYC